MIKAPFPYFGGKSTIAGLVWERIGSDVRNYVEPFAGTAAVLLARPTVNDGNIETINDADGYVANFWRAMATDPLVVAEWAYWPVNECDLHARHIWLVNRKEEIVTRLMGDPGWFDAKIAGWWLWGICCWIGSGWCSGNGPWISVNGRIVNRNNDAGHGINRNMPHLGDAGRGINRNMPHLGNAGQGLPRIWPYMEAIAERMRRVRVCCGDWSRVCGPSVTFKHGITGIFLDPPYGSDRSDCYAVDSFTVAGEVLKWCQENGNNPKLRIALCGHEGEHNQLVKDGWTVNEWKARGGFGSQSDGKGRDNARLERIWFSPNCINAKHRKLF